MINIKTFFALTLALAVFGFLGTISDTYAARQAISAGSFGGVEICPAGYDLTQVGPPYECVRNIQLCDQYGKAVPTIGLDTEKDGKFTVCSGTNNFGDNTVTATLSESPSTISPSQSSTLTWNSTGASSCSGVGFIAGGATQGTVQVSPNQTTTYSVMCVSDTLVCERFGEDRAAGEGKGKSVRKDCSYPSATDSATVTVFGVDLTSDVPSLNSGSLSSDGNIVTFRSNIRNIGGGNITSSIPTLFELDIGNDGTYDLILEGTSVAGVDGGKSKRTTSSNWTTVKGTHAIRVVADATLASLSGTSVSGRSGRVGGGLCEDYGNVQEGQLTRGVEYEGATTYTPGSPQYRTGPLCSNLLDYSTRFAYAPGDPRWAYDYDVSVGAWTFWSTDVSDYSCPIIQSTVDSTYSFFPDCPSDNPEGLSCSPSTSGKCKVNTLGNSCRVYTDIYTCGSTGRASSGVGITVSQFIVETNEINNVSGNYVFTVGVSQCSDGIDNDGDGKIDFPEDTDCLSTSGEGGESEGEIPSTAQCSDGIDNDGDGEIDYPNDSDCSGAQDNIEGSLPPSLSLTADRTLIPKGQAVNLEWSAEGAESCTLTGTNGDSWILSGTGGSVETSNLENTTTYNLLCVSEDGKRSSTSVTIKLVPSFQEI